MTYSVRNSSIELLRIICMILIVIYHFHAREYGLYVVGSERIGEDDLLLKLNIHSIGKLGVPIFVFISGWFGINFKKNRCYELLATCAFYALLSTLGLLAIYDRFLPKDVLFFMNNWWFMAGYLCIYLLSPGIDYMFNQFGKWHTLFLLLAFYYISYGDYFLNSANIGGLYQMFTMYLSARWVRLYGSEYLDKYWVIILIFCLFLRFGIIVIGYCTHHLGVLPYINSYVCPITTCLSASIFIGFSKIYFSSKILNVLAGSSLAVYLFSEGTFGKIFFEPLFFQESYNLLGYLIGSLIVYSIIFFIDLLRKKVTNHFIMDKIK